MKRRMFNETRLGTGYIGNVISSCEQNGIQCIVDDPSAEILFYDPGKKKFSTSVLLDHAGSDIFSLLGGEDKDKYDSIMSNCSGPEFTEFATRWNGLQKKEDGDDVFKTKRCEMIRMDLKNESYDDSRDWSANEDEVEIQWVIDDTDFGIFSGSTETVVIDLDLVDSFEELVYQVSKAIEEEHNGIPFDYDDEWVFVDEEKWLKRFGYSMNEQFDDPRDWSSSEGEVEVVWSTDFEDDGIFSGDTSTYLIDYDMVDDHDDLIDEVCRMIRKEHPDLDFYSDDFYITNENEFWNSRM